jgi:hypothetical protein
MPREKIAANFPAIVAWWARLRKSWGCHGRVTDNRTMESPRPRLVTLLGWMLIGLGAIEFIYRLMKIHLPIRTDDIGVPLFELVILISGVFLLRGANWARWLAVAWVGFHVIVGSLHSVTQAVTHGLIFLVFAWLMFRPAMNAWFCPPRKPEW